MQMNDQAFVQAFLADHPDARRELYTYQLDDGTEAWGFTIGGTRAHTAWLLAQGLCDPEWARAILADLDTLEAEPFGELPRRKPPLGGPGNARTPTPHRPRGRRRGRRGRAEPPRGGPRHGAGSAIRAFAGKASPRAL